MCVCVWLSNNIIIIIIIVCVCISVVMILLLVTMTDSSVIDSVYWRMKLYYWLNDYWSDWYWPRPVVTTAVMWWVTWLCGIIVWIRLVIWPYVWQLMAPLAEWGQQPMAGVVLCDIVLLLLWQWQTVIWRVWSGIGIGLGGSECSSPSDWHYCDNTVTKLCDIVNLVVCEW